MRLLIALPVAVTLLSGPVLAEDKPPPEDKIVCKRSENYVTGSRLSQPKKTCRKASEWKQLEEEKNSTMVRIRDGRLSPNQPSPMGGGPN